MIPAPGDKADSTGGVDLGEHALDTSGPPPRLLLPEAPSSETGPVKVWQEAVHLCTYHPAPPDPNPLFLEKRVYQGSSGRVYPLAIIDRIQTEPVDHSWEAVHLENEFLRLMVLPQIGGRIHVGLDKTNGYDFFYRQNVIKPALVGLAGPWISGGVEFNWPQHHRPATFMPVEVAIEREQDGAVTVWCSDHDPMDRMKGMHGLRLRPGSSCLELRVRLYNRTLHTKTFLWWANVATHVHARYQSFFPPDVRFVADHAKRAVTEFPLSRGIYYGIDYGERARDGVRDEEQPGQFRSQGSYAPNDLSWYANIPVPTSYMVAGSRGDFAGGYDHAREAGLVYVANHHIAPGKKQWTWGNHAFGYAWDRCLTDNDGPYIELMAGAYTENQPDFSFLTPGETKSFSQFWYPIREIGIPDHANAEAALRVQVMGEDLLGVHLVVTRAIANATISCRTRTVDETKTGLASLWQGSLYPAEPLHQVFPVARAHEGAYELLLEDDGKLVLRYAPAECVPMDPPAPATEPGLPSEILSSDELFLVGLHLEQYRHPTRHPEAYWLEAVARDPDDARCNHALGRWHLRRGEFEEAERCLRGAIGRLTSRNPNPSDGEPHYHLGLTLLYRQRPSEAYDAFYKATWVSGARGPAYLRLAEIACSRSQWATALDHLERSLLADVDNLLARNLMAMVLNRLGRPAAPVLQATQALDPLDIFSRYLAAKSIPAGGQLRLDLFFDLVRSGFLEDALAVVAAPTAVHSSQDGTEPLLLYAQATVLGRLNRSAESAACYAAAAHANPLYVFPSRLEELLLLEDVIKADPGDARARYYLGNLLYDRRRHREAIALWEEASRLEPDFPTNWRNLAFGYYNVERNPKRALDAFSRARTAAPLDARILYEHDQLRKRIGEPLTTRLAVLEAEPGLVNERDDLSVELASLYISVGAPEKALDVLLARRFQPWEGGEGLVLAQYMRARLLLGQRALLQGDPQSALQSFEAACRIPEKLSEAPHPLMNLSMVHYWLGEAAAACGDAIKASMHWEQAAGSRSDFQQMEVRSISDATFWSALSMVRLGRDEEARDLFQRIYDYAVALEKLPAKIDYFATSLPAMLLFDEDLQLRQGRTARLLQAQGLLGLGHKERAFELLSELRQADPANAQVINLLATFQAGCED